LRSIAFPKISTGIYRFPREKAARIAIESVRSQASTPVDRVIFVCFDEENFLIYKKQLGE
jgi:O-acetyl-ADP-ribose deacetylase (regulator of RNase III)